MSNGVPPVHGLAIGEPVIDVGGHHFYNKRGPVPDAISGRVIWPISGDPTGNFPLALTQVW